MGKPNDYTKTKDEFRESFMNDLMLKGAGEAYQNLVWNVWQNACEWRASQKK